jgi:hypothetical protein
LAELANALTWWRADPRRFDRERRLLSAPWRLERDGDRYVWIGGTLRARQGRLETPARAARLIYPAGYPARFVEIRLTPGPPREQWGMVGSHVNLDGSVCFITGESWTPQMTVRSALALTEDWWFNYWVIVEREQSGLTWPDRGRVRVPAARHAALRRR